MIIQGHYTPLECHVLPSLCIVAGMCDKCAEVHCWEVFWQFLWWGFTITFGDIEEQEERESDHEHDHEREQH